MMKNTFVAIILGLLASLSISTAQIHPNQDTRALRLGGGGRTPGAAGANGGARTRPGDAVPITCEANQELQCARGRRGAGTSFTGIVACLSVTRGDNPPMSISTCADPADGRAGDACGCCPDDDACAAVAPCNTCACTFTDKDGNSGDGFFVNVPFRDEPVCVTQAMSVSMQLLSNKKKRFGGDGDGIDDEEMMFSCIPTSDPCPTDTTP
mmetsp:Transcript_3680/g.8219  ORF Transcript_3680/g.8219 Transcript_3680/m.8219 type:complete len:210 (+) Transcript_3680:1822-2451(+)